MSLTGRIYKIIHTESNLVYVGSTFNTTRDRFMKHKKHYHSWLKGKHTEIAIYPYFKEHGVDNFKIILIKEYEVVDRLHLQGYEQLWINKLKPVNKVNPFSIRYLYLKNYREANQEIIKIRDRSRYPKERERRIEQAKQYYELNKEAISKRNKEKFDCSCGGKYQKSSKSTHEKTQKHQQWLSTQN